MNGVPRVSVVMPYLRAEHTVRRAIDSVLAQTMQDFEIVTVADGATDGTTAILERYARDDGRFRCLSLADNHGPSFARNRGIDAARGEWIAVLDADDAYAPERLQALIDTAADAQIVVDDMMMIDPFDSTEAGPMFTDFPPVLRFADFASATVDGSKFDYGYLKPMYRRAFVDQHRLRYRESLRTAEDLVFVLECCLACDGVRTLARPYYHYNLQVSRKQARARGTTHTVPRDMEVAVTLERLLADVRSRLSTTDAAVLEDRIRRLHDSAEISAFRHAFRSGAYGDATRRLVGSSRVRAYVASTLRRRLVGGGNA